MSETKKPISKKPIFVHKTSSTTKYMELDSNMIVQYLYLDKIVPSKKNERLLSGNFVVGGKINRREREVVFRTQKVPVGILLGNVDCGKIRYAVAFCNPKDTFSRKRALNLVMGRYYSKYRMGRSRGISLTWEDLCRETYEVNGVEHKIVPSRFQKGVVGKMIRAQVNNFMLKLNKRALNAK